MIQTKKVRSAYLHIPFCETICSYCAFCKMFYDQKLVRKYLTALREEIHSYQVTIPLKTIYIGGGTPSCLSWEDTKELLEMVSLLPREQEYEYTVECNIENMTEEKLQLYLGYGVNRLSIGIQTVQSQFLSFLGRHHTKEIVMEKIQLAHRLGFQNINVDLMYGFPDQTLEDLKQDLVFFVDLGVTHISTYSLMIEEHTKLYLEKVENIKEELDQEMYQWLSSYLYKHHFVHYEISNFSKEGFTSKHNLTYWNNEPYYGFGLGASGYLGNIRYTNTRSLSDYLLGKRVLEEEELSLDDEMSYEMILGLRKVEGVSKDHFYQKFLRRVEEVFDYQTALDRQLLIEEGKNLRIPEEKLYISNEAMVFFVGGKEDE